MELFVVTHLDDLIDQHFFMLRTDFFNPGRENIATWLEEYEDLQDALDSKVTAKELLDAIDAGNIRVITVCNKEWKENPF